MLDPWIIEEIRRREEEERQRREEYPALELPLEAPVYPLHQDNRPKPAPGEAEERGVIVVDFTV
jgi:hypothetical protein